jgi:putative two-component system response regulator
MLGWREQVKPNRGDGKMAYQGSVLVVDDEVGPRESLRMILHPLYEVFTARDGKEALQAIRNKEFDLVTLDLKMPGLSGMDVLKEIKRMGADVDVIIISGYGTLKNAQEAMNYGAVDFVTKPFNVTDVVASVGKSVERRKYNQKVEILIQKVKDLGVMEEEEIDKMMLH